jgi:hypothetical protein
MDMFLAELYRVHMLVFINPFKHNARKGFKLV